MDIWVEGLASWTGGGKVIFSCNGKSDAVGLGPVDIAVDANRDGVIAMAASPVTGKPLDKTEEGKPFGFWVNDDNDGMPNAEGEFLGTGSADYEDGVIQTARDLEDFARLHIYLGVFQNEVVNGTLKIGLKWKNTNGTSPKINVYTSTDTAGTDAYLQSETAAFAQVSGADAAMLGEVSGSTLLKLPASASNSKKCLLFEGVGEGKGELMLVIKTADGTEIEGPGVWLDLKSIRKMYSRGHSAPDAAWQPPFDQNPYQAPIVGFEPLDAIAIEAPFDETDELIVFVHGIHSPGLNFNEATNVFTRDADTIFKRTWWQGYKGRFAFYKWDALNAINPAEYNQSEFRAWKSGRGLAQYVASLPGATKNIMAHSQGNNVMCAALRDYGLQIDNYIIMQGAAPAFCYDENLPLAFSYTTPDHVNELGYRGYLPSTVSTRIVNFSNPNDNVTGIIWELNQQFSKPDGTGIGSIRKISGPWYNYLPGNPAGQRCTLTYWLDYGRFVTDLHESTAMVVQSNSRSIAHTPQTGGLVADNVPMDTEFQFGDEHGSQFGRPIQQLNGFFDEVLKQCGLPFNP